MRQPWPAAVAAMRQLVTGAPPAAQAVRPNVILIQADDLGYGDLSAFGQQIGAGGMGEVYRARDTKLDRDVALEILPESFASDPDRLMRWRATACTSARTTR